MIFNRQLLFSLLPFVSALPASNDKLQSRAATLDQFIASENSVSYTNAFKNIGTAYVFFPSPCGRQRLNRVDTSSGGAKPGIIIASPSTS